MIYRKTEKDWNDLKSEFYKGNTIQGKVFKVEPYGVYVDIGRGFYGIVLAPQIGKEKIKLYEYPKIGETVTAIIVDFSDFQSEFSYVSLSIKAYQEKIANTNF